MKQFLVLMRRLNESKKSFRRPVSSAVLVAALLAAAMPAISLAKVNRSDLILPAAVKNITALPDSTIAVITGTGLKAPSIGGISEPRAAITLWDELRPTVQQNNLSNSNSTITVNGIVQ